MSHIVHLADEYRGGVGTVLRAFAKYMGDLPQVFCLEEGRGELASDLQAVGARVVLRSGKGRLRKVRGYLARRTLLNDALVIVHQPADVRWLAQAMHWRLIRPAKVITVLHMTGHVPRVGGGDSAWAHWTRVGLENSAVVVAVGPDVFSEVRCIYGDKLALCEIRNPVAPELFAVPDPPWPVRSFVFMARLDDERKELRTVLEALARIRDPAYRLYVAGEGRLRRFYESLARQEGIGDRVTFLGWVPAVAALEKAQCLIISTTFPEGYMMVGAEALAAGRLVVLNRWSGLSQYEQVGVIFRTGDPDDLATRVREMGMMDEREVRMRSQQGRKWAMRHHDVEAWTEQWRDLVHRVALQ